eukprot:gene24586-30952_t
MRARVRVEEEKVDETLNPDINPDIIRIHTAMSKVIAEAEQAGELGDIDTAQELVLNRLEHLQQEKNAFMSKITELRRQKGAGPNGNDKKLRVCDVCGSFLSLYDSDKRLTDHFMGKQHIGFQFMRDSLEAIRLRREARRAKERSGGDEGSRDGRPVREKSTEQGEIVGSGRDRERDSSYGGGGGYRDESRRRDDSRERGGGGGGRRDGSRDVYGGGGYRGNNSGGGDYRRGREGSRDRYQDGGRDRRW